MPKTAGHYILEGKSKTTDYVYSIYATSEAVAIHEACLFAAHNLLWYADLYSPDSTLIWGMGYYDYVD